MTKPKLIDPTKYIRVGTAAELAGVTRAYVNRMIVAGTLPGIEIDGQHFVLRSDAEDFKRQPGMGRPRLTK
jgi:excisionase family DNA binding protein